jgi:hypothetical protein
VQKEKGRGVKPKFLGSTDRRIKRVTNLGAVLQFIVAEIYIVSAPRSSATSREKVLRSKFMTAV